MDLKKEDAEKFLAWLQSPGDRDKAVRVMNEVTEAIITVLRKNDIV